jgi:hypothetical protein
MAVKKTIASRPPFRNSLVALVLPLAAMLVGMIVAIAAPVVFRWIAR